jgi:hypothetical protein
MSKFIITILLALFYQTTDFTLIKAINENADFISTDLFGNLYIVNGKKLSKFNNNGEIEKTYQNNNLGKISSIDATDPMRILLYYKDFNQVVFLDNQLAEIHAAVKLDELELEQSELVCASPDGGFWVLNFSQMQISRINKNLETANKSSVNTVFSNNSEAPKQMIYSAGKIYILFENSGIYIFDEFGAFYKKIIIDKISDMQISNGEILYISNGKTISYSPELFNSQDLKTPVTESTRIIRIENKRFYLLDEKGVSIYK